MKICENGKTRNATAEESEDLIEIKLKMDAMKITQLDHIEAQVLYTALMTDTLLEG